MLHGTNLAGKYFHCIQTLIDLKLRELSVVNKHIIGRIKDINLLAIDSLRLMIGFINILFLRRKVEYRSYEICLLRIK